MKDWIKHFLSNQGRQTHIHNTHADAWKHTLIGHFSFQWNTVCYMHATNSIHTKQLQSYEQIFSRWLQWQTVGLIQSRLFASRAVGQLFDVKVFFRSVCVEHTRSWRRSLIRWNVDNNMLFAHTNCTVRSIQKFRCWEHLADAEAVRSTSNLWKASFSHAPTTWSETKLPKWAANTPSPCLHRTISLLQNQLEGLTTWQASLLQACMQGLVQTTGNKRLRGTKARPSYMYENYFA